MVSAKLLARFENILTTTPTVWDGRKAILEMRNSGYAHWKQMEWIGFYFQFLCDTKLSPMMTIPGPAYGNVRFDGFAEIPWDCKAHPDKNAQGNENNNVIVNDSIAITQAIKQYGEAGIILATGHATYNDEDRSFQVWHKKLKGGLSDFEKQRIIRKAPSRLRKTEFRLKEITLIVLNKKNIRGLNSFQEGFRNSDGSPRNSKVLLRLDEIQPIKVITFS